VLEHTLIPVQACSYRLVLFHRIVLAQLEGSGRGSLASMNPRSYDDLVKLIQDHPMTDGDGWLKLLLAKNEMLGERQLMCCCRPIALFALLRCCCGPYVTSA
jgi:hypothetical protein